MCCPYCKTDLSSDFDSGASTGMWEFKVVCTCGSAFLWRQGRVIPLRRKVYTRVGATEDYLV